MFRATYKYVNFCFSVNVYFLFLCLGVVSVKAGRCPSACRCDVDTIYCRDTQIFRWPDLAQTAYKELQLIDSQFLAKVHCHRFPSKLQLVVLKSVSPDIKCRQITKCLNNGVNVESDCLSPEVPLTSPKPSKFTNKFDFYIECVMIRVFRAAAYCSSRLGI